MTSAYETYEELHKCPLCDSDDISAGKIDAEDFYRKLLCLNCSASWEENFTFQMSAKLEDSAGNERQFPNATEAPSPFGGSPRTVFPAGLPPETAAAFKAAGWTALNERGGMWSPPSDSTQGATT